MTKRITKYGIGKDWCLWRAFNIVDPLLEQGWTCRKAQASRVFAYWWCPLWRLDIELTKEPNPKE